jgi:two-component system CheB/CheR fusion protein
MRILPYRTLENSIDGVVITFNDITRQKTSELISKEAKDYAQSLLQTLRESILVLDDKFRVITANKSFYNTFKVKPAETEKKLIYELGNKQWDIPQLRTFLETILPKNTEFDDFEVVHDFPKIGRKKMLLNARRIFRDTEGTETILLAIEDVTSHKDEAG